MKKKHFKKMNSNVGSTMVKKDKQDYSVNKAWLTSVITWVAYISATD